MKEEQIAQLDELVLEYSNFDYKDGGFYSNLFFYRIKKSQLSIVFNLDGKPDEHIEIIQSIVNKLFIMLSKNSIYRLILNDWYCDVSNGDFNLEFKDGKYYIKPEYQEMHDRKQVATIVEVANLNNVEYSEFKWNVLKKKSIELGFVPVKDKSGHENLYLIKAFKECYSEYNYVFSFESELQMAEDVEPKRKKFLGIF
jgi:hypothetical protein